MSISLYSAASGMEGQQMNLNVISNNIANVGTTGFKKSKIEFQDMFYQQREAVGADSGGNVVPTGVQIGSGTNVVSTSKVFTQGTVNNTGADLDLAIVGDGFFEVSDGTNNYYTRDGAFKISANGAIVTSQGMTVVGMPVVPSGTTDVSISEGGQVTLMSDGESIGSGNLPLVRFNNPAGLLSLGGNLYQESEASGNSLDGVPVSYTHLTLPTNREV